jgi:hypothetical protein
MVLFVSLALDSLQAAMTGRTMRVATIAWPVNDGPRRAQAVFCMVWLQ